MFNENTLKIPAARKFLIAQLHKDVEDNWQENDTPYHIVNKMIDIIPKDTETYVVFFNLEFVEILVHERNIPPENILFVADVKIEYLFAKRGYKVNAVLFPKQTITNESIGNILKGVEMKIGKMAVIGNPPYQMQDGEGGKGSSAKPIYHLFVETIIDNIKPDYFSFIIPSRWMVGGKGLDNHRERMMNDSRMKMIRHFPGESEIFNNVSIMGGVNYFLWDKNYNGPCNFNGVERFLNEYDIILQDNSTLSILDKVLKSHSNYVGQKCCSQNCFDIRSNFDNWDISGTKVLTAGRKEKFVNGSKFIDKNNIISKFKVCTSKANGAAQEDNGTGKRVISDAFVINPNEICNETYLVVNTFETLNEAENFSKYMKTKFFRFMMSLRTPTQNISKTCFDWVPDFVNYSDSLNDQNLYNKYNFNEKEISYIESKIKEI